METVIFIKAWMLATLSKIFPKYVYLIVDKERGQAQFRIFWYYTEPYKLDTDMWLAINKR